MEGVVYLCNLIFSNADFPLRLVGVGAPCRVDGDKKGFMCEPGGGGGGGV